MLGIYIKRKPSKSWRIFSLRNRLRLGVNTNLRRLPSYRLFLHLLDQGLVQIQNEKKNTCTKLEGISSPNRSKLYFKTK